MQLEKLPYQGTSNYIPVIHINAPGYFTVLIPTDKECKYFHLAMVKRNPESPDDIIELGGPFAKEELTELITKDQDQWKTGKTNSLGMTKSN